MNYGFFRVACVTSEIKVADTSFNAEKIIENAKKASENGASLIVFPELSLTGYTCGDLFLQETLLKKAGTALGKIAFATTDLNAIVLVGLPVEKDGAIYNAAAVLYKGKILALVPKTFIPNYSEFYEKRHFASGIGCDREIAFCGQNIPFGSDILISDKNNNNFVLGVEICEDLWTPLSPSTKAALNGATVIANLSAGNEVIGKAAYRKDLVKMQSAKLISCYAYANAGRDESTTDVVFSGHSIMAENGSVLSESKLFENGIIYADFDLEKIASERRKTTTFNDAKSSAEENIFRKIEIEMNLHSASLPSTGSTPSTGSGTLYRKISPRPFVPENDSEREKRCEEVVTLQAQGLAKRLRHTSSKTCVIGLSGGLDSTLALLVTEKAFEIENLDKKGIIAVTMPCFGTTGRTYKNACDLAKEIGCTLKEIDIKKAVLQHFSDIGQDENKFDVTYENSQARERTQVLMDIANKEGGLVIGTGDLSEQALGWATYNGDHISMYNVNGSIPKTLVRYLVKYFSDLKKSATLADILDTPVSPELLPSDGKNISQKTEDLVGPYELHDFYLYYMMRFGFSPKKIFFLAKSAFNGTYDDETILKWLKVFYRRFFAQQFKRSCMADGAKVGTVSLSPRGDWRMPSDASANIWLSELEEI